MQTYRATNFNVPKVLCDFQPNTMTYLAYTSYTHSATATDRGRAFVLLDLCRAKLPPHPKPIHKSLQLSSLYIYILYICRLVFRWATTMGNHIFFYILFNLTCAFPAVIRSQYTHTHTQNAKEALGFLFSNVQWHTA